jgi:hypothetical protein
MLNNVGESGQPWRTPLLISTDCKSLLLNFNFLQLYNPNMEMPSGMKGNEICFAHCKF